MHLPDLNVGGPFSSGTAGRTSRSYDGLQLYFRELDRLRLLSAEEELRLAERSRAGDQEARRRLVEGNLRFVVHIARSFSWSELPMSDLIAEGNTGLLRAADKFDPSNGCRFTSYAVYWIRRAILRALARQTRLIRVPLNLLDTLQSIVDRQRTIRLDSGRDPTVEELAGDLELPLRRVRELLAVAAHPLSFHGSYVPGEDGGTLLERVVDPTVPTPCEKTEDRQARRHLQVALNTLSPREREVLEDRYGLTGDRPLSRAELGRKHGCTREAIRQIELRALKKLRHPERLGLLAESAGGRAAAA